MVRIAATNNNYLDFAGLRKPPCKFSSRPSLCARVFSVRLVRTYFLIPDRYKQAINTPKGAVFFAALSPQLLGYRDGANRNFHGPASRVRSNLAIHSYVGGRGGPFHNVGSNMTIGITGPRPRARWRGAVVALIIACHRCHDLPDPAGAHERLAGRLAVVFRDRLFVRL